MALAETLADSADISDAPVRAASGVEKRARASEANDGPDADSRRARAAHVAFLLLTALALANLGYFFIRFVIASDSPELHAVFRMEGLEPSGRWGFLVAFGGWPTTAARLLLVSLILLAFSVPVARRHRRSPMVQLFASLALLGGQVSLAVTVLTSAEDLVFWRIVALTIYGLLPAMAVSAMALFPTGRPVPRWSLALLPVAWAPAALQGLHMFRTRTYSRPLFVTTVGMGVLFMGFLVYRYRRHATLRQRHQITWLSYGALSFVAIQVTAVVWVLPLITERTGTGQPLFKLLYEVMIGGSYLSGLLMVLLAAVRYRLWEFDRLLNRSIVHALLSLLLAAVLFVAYVGLRAGLQDLLANSGLVAMLVSLTLVVALFPFLRRRIVRWIDRRFFGIRIDYEHLAARAMKASLPASETRFAAYAELELLGSGGMGSVYRARHPDHRCPVALKIMSPELANDAEARARFRREAEILEGVRHPNVVPFVASGHNAGLEFIAMELVDGVDLATVRRERGRLEVHEVVALLGGIAAALDTAHRLGVVHRDVKPSNILVVGPESTALAERRTMLMDFGIARWAEVEEPREGRGMEDVVGSLAYIAPEQIRRPDRIDGRADVYALGVTAYELLTGALPFRSSPALALLFCHMSQPPPDPREQLPELPAGVADALLRALAKDPQDRFGDAGSFIEAIRCAGSERVAA